MNDPMENAASDYTAGVATIKADAKLGEKQPVWAIVELMGHVRLAGRLSEEEKFGCKLGRLDIPDGEGFVSQYFGGASVYRITIVSEDVARHVARTAPPQPVRPWEFPERLPAPERRWDKDPNGPDDDDDYDPR